MEQQSKGIWNQLQPGIDGEQFQIELNKGEFSTELFRKEMFGFFYNRAPVKKRIVHIITDPAGYKKIRQMIKNLQMIKRLQKYGTTE
jgi:hypothetical protein